MLYRCLFSALVFSQLLMADARVAWSQAAGDQKHGVSGAIIIEKNEDQPVEPMMRDWQLRVSKQLYKQSADCAAAKLDIWIQDGRIEYIVFAPDKPRKNVNFTDPTHLTFGDPKCQIHVMISADENAKPAPHE
jgi:hypothetical protein